MRQMEVMVAWSESDMEVWIVVLQVLSDGFGGFKAKWTQVRILTEAVIHWTDNVLGELH